MFVTDSIETFVKTNHNYVLAILHHRFGHLHCDHDFEDVAQDFYTKLIYDGRILRRAATMTEKHFTNFIAKILSYQMSTYLRNVRRVQVKTGPRWPDRDSDFTYGSDSTTAIDAHLDVSRWQDWCSAQGTVGSQSALAYSFKLLDDSARSTQHGLYKAFNIYRVKYQDFQNPVG